MEENKGGRRELEMGGRRLKRMIETDASEGKAAQGNGKTWERKRDNMGRGCAVYCL